jgi:hypothetical protein
MNVENYVMKRSLELLVGTHEYARCVCSVRTAKPSLSGLDLHVTSVERSKRMYTHLLTSAHCQRLLTYTLLPSGSLHQQAARARKANKLHSPLSAHKCAQCTQQHAT